MGRQTAETHEPMLTRFDTLRVFVTAQLKVRTTPEWQSLSDDIQIYCVPRHLTYNLSFRANTVTVSDNFKQHRNHKQHFNGSQLD